MRRVSLAVLVCLAVSAPFFNVHSASSKPVSAAQATAAGQAGATSLPDKAVLARVMNGWASLNPDNVTRYYDQASALPFYDISPLKYDGFAAYLAGSKQMLGTLASIKFTLNDDAAVHPAGPNWAFSTATMHARMEDKSGKANEVDCRWTAVWQKKGANWVIVHEHFSAPAPMEVPKPKQ